MHVVVLFGSRRDRLRLAESLAEVASCSSADSLSEARSRLALADEPTVCIVCTGPTTAPVAVGAIAELRAAFPTLPIVAHCDVHEVDRQALIATIRAGASDLLFRGIDDGRTVMRHVLAAAVQHTHAEALLARFASQLTEPLLELMRFGLEHPDATEDLDVTAAAFGVARRTLAKHLEQVGAPSPRRFFTWMRLLLAASLLTDPGRSVQAVAVQLRFESGGALRQLLRRYADVSVSSATDRSTLLDVLVTEFVRDLELSRARADGSPSAIDVGADTEVSRALRLLR